MENSGDRMHDLQSPMQVYTWGYNSKGQLGVATQDLCCGTPQIVTPIAEHRVEMVAAGSAHSVVLTGLSQIKPPPSIACFPRKRVGELLREMEGENERKEKEMKRD